MAISKIINAAHRATLIELVPTAELLSDRINDSILVGISRCSRIGADSISDFSLLYAIR